MIAGSIPDENGMNIFLQSLRELKQEFVDDLRIEIRDDDRFGLSGGSACGSDHIHIFILRLTNRTRSRTD